MEAFIDEFLYHTGIILSFMTALDTSMELVSHVSMDRVIPQLNKTGD